MLNFIIFSINIIFNKYNIVVGMTVAINLLNHLIKEQFNGLFYV